MKSILDYSAEADLSHDAAKQQDFGDRRVGVTSARTYFYADEEQCDRNLQVQRQFAGVLFVIVMIISLELLGFH